MVNRFLFHIIIALFAAFEVTAQITTVPVRGGEHADYTRLAITLPQNVTWQVSQSGPRATLVVSNVSMRFDLSQTFARIPRRRLLALQSSDNELVLILNCDCPIRAAEDLPQMLVLDVMDPALGPSGDTMLQTRPPPRPDRPTINTTAAQAGIEFARTLRGAASQNVTGDIYSFNASPVLDNDVFPAEILLRSDSSTFTNEQKLTPRAEQLSLLGGALAVAVGHGLLEPVQPSTKNIGITTQGDAALSLPDDSAIQQQLAVSDSVTRARSGLSQPHHETDSASCPEESALDIQGWGNADAREQKLLRPGQLYDELDQIDPSEIRANVRKLLYLGFGTEAQLVLSLLQDANAYDTLLEALAQLVDQGSLPSSSLPPSLEKCSDMGAFWAALAHLPANFEEDFPIAQAVRAVGTLPPHLRLHLGPVLLRHLSAQGHFEQAHALRDILSRVAISPQLQTDSPLSIDRVAPISEEQPLAPDDVLFALRQSAVMNLIPEPAVMENALAYVFALRGTSIATDIGTEASLALARQGDFATAFDLAKNQDLNASPHHSDELRGALFDLLIAQANDTQFLTQVFAADPWKDPVAPVVMARIAAHLQALKFYEPADRLRAIAYPTVQNSDIQNIEASHLTSPTIDINIQDTPFFEAASPQDTWMSGQPPDASAGPSDQAEMTRDLKIGENFGVLLNTQREVPAVRSAVSQEREKNNILPGSSSVPQEEVLTEKSQASNQDTGSGLSETGSLRSENNFMLDPIIQTSEETTGLLASGHRALFESAVLRARLLQQLERVIPPEFKGLQK